MCNDDTPKAVEMPLTKGFAVVIDEDDSDLNQYSWVATNVKNGTAYGSRQLPSGKRIYLHRVILERKIKRPLLKHERCDHIDRNPNNNRRSNLRVATHKDNMRNAKRFCTNTSGYKGVSQEKTTKRWIAGISVNNKRKYLGTFDTPQEAHKAYCDAAVLYFGEFASFGDD